MRERSDSGRKQVEAATRKVGQATRARDAAIVSAHEQGASLRHLAAWTGLNHETVRTIIRRERGEIA